MSQLLTAGNVTPSVDLTGYTLVNDPVLASSLLEDWEINLGLSELAFLGDDSEPVEILLAVLGGWLCIKDCLGSVVVQPV